MYFSKQVIICMMWSKEHTLRYNCSALYNILKKNYVCISWLPVHKSYVCTLRLLVRDIFWSVERIKLYKKRTCEYIERPKSCKSGDAKFVYVE